MIKENINKINIAYKKSLKIIKDNYYTDDVYNELITNLMDLKNFTLEYFSSVNESFYDLKIYLKTYINDINNRINECANLTYITFSQKYDNFSIIERINSEINTNISERSDSIIIENQSLMTTVNYTISQILQKTQFKLKVEYEEEGTIKKPIITLNIINESRPKKIELKFIKSEESAGLIIEDANIEPNNVNFSMNVYYSTKSKDLYVTTYTDFESYKYSTELIQEKVNEVEKCVYPNGISLCFNYFVIIGDSKKILSSKKDKNIPRKKFSEESIVHASSLFDLFED